jgi:hypothetical protein
MRSLVSADRLLSVVILAGAGLRLWQYLADASLWLDELALARNLIDRSLGSLLLSPLDYYQVVPSGFLLAEKLVLLLLGDGEQALRLLPLLASLASLWLFRAVASRCLPGGTGVFLAVACFSLAPPLVWYGAVVKQYSTDLAASLLLTLLALRWSSQRTRPAFLALAVSGALAVWFSYGATITVAGVGLALATASGLRRDLSDTWRELAILAGVWAASAAGAASLALDTLAPSTRAHQLSLWPHSWAPIPPRSLQDLRWYWDLLVHNLLRTFYDWNLARAFAALTLPGAVFLWRRRREALLVLTAPVLVSLALSAARLYPISYRTSLFLVPALLLFVAAGAQWLTTIWPLRVGVVPYVLLALLTLGPLLALWRDPPVYRLEHSKPLFALLREHRRSGDAVFVHFGAWQTFAYYGPRYGLPREEVTIGECHAESIDYLKELDRFRGRSRVWMLFTHSRADVQYAIVSYAFRIGRPLGSFSERNHILSKSVEDVSLFLVDLSNPARLATVNAQEHLRSLSTASLEVPTFCEGPSVPPRPTPGAEPGGSR